MPYGHGNIFGVNSSPTCRKLGRVFDLNCCSSELHRHGLVSAITRSLLKLDQASINIARG